MGSFVIPVAHKGGWMVAAILKGLWLRLDPKDGTWEVVDKEGGIKAGGLVLDDDKDLVLRDPEDQDLPLATAKMVLAYGRAMETLATATVLRRKHSAIGEVGLAMLDALRLQVESKWWDTLYRRGMNWISGIGDIRIHGPEVTEKADLPNKMTVVYTITHADGGPKRIAEVYWLGGKRSAAKLPEAVLLEVLFALRFEGQAKLRPFGNGLKVEEVYIPEA